MKAQRLFRRKAREASPPKAEYWRLNLLVSSPPGMRFVGRVAKGLASRSLFLGRSEMIGQLEIAPVALHSTPPEKKTPPGNVKITGQLEIAGNALSPPNPAFAGPEPALTRFPARALTRTASCEWSCTRRPAAIADCWKQVARASSPSGTFAPVQSSGLPPQSGRAPKSSPRFIPIWRGR